MSSAGREGGVPKSSLYPPPAKEMLGGDCPADGLTVTWGGESWPEVGLHLTSVLPSLIWKPLRAQWGKQVTERSAKGSRPATGLYGREEVTHSRRCEDCRHRKAQVEAQVGCPRKSWGATEPAAKSRGREGEHQALDQPRAKRTDMSSGMDFSCRCELGHWEQAREGLPLLRWREPRGQDKD